MSLKGFSESTFTFAGETKTVYRRGQGPGVLVMHEIPGITPKVASFARRVADEGFNVVMPVLFGTVNKRLNPAYGASQIARACISKEFAVWAANGASPVTLWLRALCRDMHRELGGKGIAAIGMCLTGNFALALMVEPSLMAPVLSQPSLPFPLTSAQRSGLHISPEDLETAKARQDVPILGLRFTADPLCPGARFRRLEKEFGERFEVIEIDSSFGNSEGVSPLSHSVLAHDYFDTTGHPTRLAYERTVAFFRENLT